VKLNPISIAVTAARGLMEGTAGAADLAAGIGVCLLLLVAFVQFVIARAVLEGSYGPSGTALRFPLSNSVR